MAIYTLDGMAEIVYGFITQEKANEPDVKTLYENILLMAAYAGDGREVPETLIAACAGSVAGAALGYMLPLHENDYAKLLGRVARKVTDNAPKEDMQAAYARLPKQ